MFDYFKYNSVAIGARACIVISFVMMSLKKIVYLLVAYIRLVTGQMEKSSLTFVIDDTLSMQNEINQVKDRVYNIFDAVKKSEDSPIEDFILVTFNDKPNQTYFLTRTKDRNVFKSNLAKIKAHGGGNCPESSLSGIKRGLQESRNGSFLYVFTDDVAEEGRTMLDEVQNLAIRKTTQVFFILTVNSEFCRDIETKPNYQYYIDLAKATSGSVYLMDKKGVKEILKDVSERIKSRKTQILIENLPPGYGNSVTIPIDAALKDTTLTAIGTNPEIKNITAPDGSTANSTTIVDLPGSKVIKVSDPMVGNYTAEVGSETETEFKVDATTTINFKYGFSPLEPITMADTVPMPIRDVKSHISVQIFSNESFIPSEIILKDDSNILIQNIPLKLHDAKENIYITDKVLPPEGLFKIVVNGYHEKSGSNITRNSPTYIEVQKNFETPKDMSPSLEIDKGNRINVKYNGTLKLVCKVEAFPKPDITWKDEDDNILPTKVLAYNLPYSYMAELVIEKVTMNKTLKCSATNEIGDISRNIKVETERTQYLDILEEPKDTNIVYKNSDQIYCKVDALPPATITWFKNDVKVRSDEFVETSDAGVLSIKQMMPHLVGDYSCAATNGPESIYLRFKLSITGTAPSTAVIGPSTVNAEYNKPLFLRCQVKGYPKPKILWIDDKTGEEIRSAPVAVPTPYDYGQVMQMEKVYKNATYKCVAENDNGNHSSAVKVVTIQKVHFNIIEAPKDTTIKYKEGRQIFCKIDAYPSASIQWKFKGKAITNSDHYEISSDGSSLRIRDMQPHLEGTYSCKVDHKNTHSRKNLKFKLSIGGTVQPEIDKSANDIIKIKEWSTVDIDCRIIKGTPPPTIIWGFEQNGDDKFRKIETLSTSVHLEKVTRYDSGAYRCTASNMKGSDYHDVYVNVEFPPTIEKAEKQVDSMAGDETMLKCIVHGNPTPTVVWSLNGVNISASSGEYEIFRDNSLRFPASLSNDGKFTCTATNEHGTAKIETQVDYYSEIEFEIPDATNISTYVGEREKLKCEAHGYPPPTITWSFSSSEAKPSEEPKILKAKKSRPNELVLRLRNTNQDGHYTCTASNKKSTKRLTFSVDVKEQAHIERDTESTKPIKAVKGDLVRILCRAKGKPKPSVTWIRNGYNIPTGHDSYSLDTDGALLIDGITEGGEFTCQADNGLSAPDRSSFQVDYEDYPRRTKKITTYNLKLGKPALVECPIPHTLVDLLRWFRDTEQLVTGELKFNRVSFRDAGVYTCRVSHRITMKSESHSVVINVVR
ncbi:hypothetical protein ABMA27_003230 [Loxostege sticticalis]|uniref:Hemicentin-1-like n=1 Tax=Loxostege sticticalis TaxID=481309 RepID=A0ABR3HSK7_LOXSC